MRKRTHEEFVNIVLKEGNNEYDVLGKYINTKTKVKLKHKKCGYIWDASPDSFINGGARCPECGYKSMKKKQRKTDSTFKKEVYDLVGDEYIFIEKYINNKTKLKVIHNKCGHEYEVAPRDFLSGRRCPNCRYNKMRKTIRNLQEKRFLEEFTEQSQGEYILLSKYKQMKEKVKVKHVKCGLVYEVAPIKFLNGNRCPICVFKELGEKYRITQEEFEKRVKELSNDEIIVLGEYQNNRTKVKFKHKVCGTEWETVPDVIFRGSGCPICKASIGEKEISRFLRKKKIPYISQYRIDECRNEFPLPFDFAVFDKNDNLLFLIEYDGIQHYEPIEFFGGEVALKRTQKNDAIKRNYCKRNGIPLITIPYYDEIEKYKAIILETYANHEPSALETV